MQFLKLIIILQGFVISFMIFPSLPSRVGHIPPAIIIEDYVPLLPKIVATYGHRIQEELFLFKQTPFLERILTQISAGAENIALTDNKYEIAHAQTALVFFTPDWQWMENLSTVVQQLSLAKSARNKVVVYLQGAKQLKDAQEELVSLKVISREIQRRLFLDHQHSTETYYLVFDSTHNELFDLLSNTEQLKAIAEAVKK